MTQVRNTNTNNSILQSTFFKDHTIRYQIKDEELWICAKDLARPMKKSQSVIRTNLQTLPVNWICSFQQTGTGGNRNMTFVNKKGLLKILMKTRTTTGSLVDHFQNLSVTKLDDLLTTGRTEMKQPEKALTQKDTLGQIKDTSDFLDSFDGGSASGWLCHLGRRCQGTA